MTTLRDLLNDLIIDTVKIVERDFIGETGVYISEEEKEELLDEYIETIKNRIVG